MQDCFWPAAELGERCERAWSAAVTALPVGTRVTGVVVGRQPFGVFIEIEQGPDAIGLVRVTALPVDEPLPARGTVIEGEVLWHEDHNCQVTVVPRAVAPYTEAPQPGQLESLRRALGPRD